MARGLGADAPGGRALLRDVCFDLPAGGRLAIVGPNGAGKTTLLRLLSGAARPARGRVDLDGRDLRALSLGARAKRVAVVGQGDMPDARLTLTDYVGLGRLPHHGRGSAAHDATVVAGAIGRVGLAAFAGRALGGLSGGERQRAAIARAIAQEPSLLLLDEPTNHLDPRARADVLALVADLRVSVVAVLHDLGLVPAFATSVLVLADGAVAAHGDPREALSPPIVRAVFAMDCLSVVNPATGRTLFVFDTPQEGSI